MLLFPPWPLCWIFWNWPTPIPHYIKGLSQLHFAPKHFCGLLDPLLLSTVPKIRASPFSSERKGEICTSYQSGFRSHLCCWWKGDCLLILPPCAPWQLDRLQPMWTLMETATISTNAYPDRIAQHKIALFPFPSNIPMTRIWDLEVIHLWQKPTDLIPGITQQPVIGQCSLEMRCTTDFRPIAELLLTPMVRQKGETDWIHFTPYALVFSFCSVGRNEQELGYYLLLNPRLQHQLWKSLA